MNRTSRGYFFHHIMSKLEKKELFYHHTEVTLYKTGNTNYKSTPSMLHERPRFSISHQSHFENLLKVPSLASDKNNTTKPVTKKYIALTRKIPSTTPTPGEPTNAVNFYLHATHQCTEELLKKPLSAFIIVTQRNNPPPATWFETQNFRA